MNLKSLLAALILAVGLAPSAWGFLPPEEAPPAAAPKPHKPKPDKAPPAHPHSDAHAHSTHHHHSAPAHKQRLHPAPHDGGQGDWCEAKGGERDGDGDCYKIVSAEQCVSGGGAIDAEGNCVTKKQCQRGGGMVNEDGECVARPAEEAQAEEGSSTDEGEVSEELAKPAVSVP